MIDQHEMPTVPCSICTTLTTSTGTKLCDRCWELENKYCDLLSSSPTAAHDWVHAKVKELHNYRPGTVNHTEDASEGAGEEA